MSVTSISLDIFLFYSSSLLNFFLLFLFSISQEISTETSQLDLDTQILILNLTSSFAILAGDVGLDFVQVLSNILDGLRQSVQGAVLGDHVDTILANLRTFFTGVLDDLACNENAISIATTNFNVGILLLLLFSEVV